MKHWFSYTHTPDGTIATCHSCHQGLCDPTSEDEAQESVRHHMIEVRRWVA